MLLKESISDFIGRKICGTLYNTTVRQQHIQYAQSKKVFLYLGSNTTTTNNNNQQPTTHNTREQQRQQSGRYSKVSFSRPTPTSMEYIDAGQQQQQRCVVLSRKTSKKKQDDDDDILITGRRS